MVATKGYGKRESAQPFVERGEWHKNLRARQKWWLYNIGNVLNATELFILKWLILSYVNFTSIKKIALKILESK